ncbi:MAG: kelch repeat-containing protein, partial [Chitinophagaceae bacterium]
MRKVHAYMLGGALVASSALLTQGCTKDTDSDDDLIGNWTTSVDFRGNGRSEAATFTIGDYVYLSAGTTDRDRFKDLFRFSIADGYWTQRADLPGAARSSAVAFAIGNKGYLGTGYDGVARLNDFWEYDPALNQWTQKANFAGTARRDAVAFSIGSKGYISCGYDGNYLNDLWEYDPTAAAGQQWSEKPSMGRKRAEAQAFVINGKAYIVSGDNNGEILQDLWMYDPSTAQWTEKRKIYNYNSDEEYDDDYSAIGRKNGTVFVMGNYAYLATGESGGASVSNTWRYDPVTDLWLQKTGFEGTARTGAVAFSRGDRGVVITG